MNIGVCKHAFSGVIKQQKIRKAIKHTITYGIFSNLKLISKKDILFSLSHKLRKNIFIFF